MKMRGSRSITACKSARRRLDLYFSYSGRPTERLASDRSRGQFVKWQGYHLDPDVHPPRDGSARRIITKPGDSNDVWSSVGHSSPSCLARAASTDAAWRSAASKSGTGRRRLSALRKRRRLYRVSWFSGAAHELFRERVQSLFDSNAELRRTAVRGSSEAGSISASTRQSDCCAGSAELAHVEPGARPVRRRCQSLYRRRSSVTCTAKLTVPRC